MATIADLHISISNMTSDQLYTHIRTLRALRREIPLKPVRKTAKKKQPRKYLTIKDYLNNLNESKRTELLKKLLIIQGRKNG